MATVGTHGGEHEEPGAKTRSCAWFFTAKYDEVLDSTQIRDRFLDFLKSRENYRMVSLPSVDIVTFSLPNAATSQTSIMGFIHGKQIRQNAVLGYFLNDDGHWKIQWQPIPGRYWQHYLIKGFLTESSLLPDHQNEKFIRVDYMGNSSKFQSSAASSSSSQSHVSTSNYFQPAPKGRPRGPRHAGDSGSASSATRSEQSIQSSPPIGSSLPIDTSSATFVPPPPQTEESSASMNEPSLQSSQPIGVSLPIGSSATLLPPPPGSEEDGEREDASDAASSSIQWQRSFPSMGSATSAQEFAVRCDLLAQLRAAQMQCEELRKDKERASAEAEKLRQEAESAEKERQLKDQKINKLTNAVRRLSRKKTSEGMVLTHSDGTTTKLHNVSNVHR